MASEQQRLEVLSVKSNWQKEVAQECEKLSDWRCQNRPIGNENGKMTKPDLGNRNSDFGPQVTQESFYKDTRHGLSVNMSPTRLPWRKFFILRRLNSTNDKKLTNFVIKEQGKCFELARTGRELILLLREDENNEGVEDLLNVRFHKIPKISRRPLGKKLIYLG